MNKSLYHIQSEYLQLAAILEDNGGEITEEIESQLAINQDQLEAKGVNYALVIRQMTGEADMIKGEIDRLTKLMKSKQNAADRLKNTIKSAMELYGIQSIKGELINITLRNNAGSVVIENDAQIPAEYVDVKEVRTPDKKAIKTALEGGAEIPGVYIQSSKSVIIK